MWPQPPESIKNILVTGGAGFIGSHLIEDILAFTDGIHVTCLDGLTYAGTAANLGVFVNDPLVDFIHVDLRRPNDLDEALKGRHFDWVFHLAAETHVDRSIHDPITTVESNVMGTLHLLEHFRKAWQEEMDGHRFVQISTDEVFGSISEGSNNESSRYHPSSPYSASKAGGDHLCRAYQLTFGLPITLTWCTNNYGPRQFPEKLIPLMLFNAMLGRPLPVYGNGKQMRDWLYVKDHTEGIWRTACLGEIGEGYCFGGGHEVTNIEVVHSLLAVLRKWQGERWHGELGKIEFVKDRPGHDHRYSLDTSHSKSKLGWTPQTPFQKGFEETISWYLDHPEWVEAAKTMDYEDWIARQYGTEASS